MPPFLIWLSLTLAGWGGGVNLFFVVTHPPASREQPPADGQITTKKNPEGDTGMKAM